MVGKTLGHYRILDQVGAGGMGVVYRARDERLERDVALKVLPPGSLADDSARKRFRKEALALSRLNHPNIATVFDFDCQEGIDFLVTELIPGITLDEKLAAGPLPEKETLQIGVQLADGLEAAHREGVVHRDLKPGNLRLTPEGRLKILDFGLATRVGLVGQASVTQSVLDAGPVGTLAYMAPEQLRNENVDARADIWAAGVVLYELATGRRPFDSKTATALADDILHQLPPAPQLLQPRLSPRLADIIAKCLEKDPENRYQSAKELLVDLRRLSGSSSSPSVAIAPSSPPAVRGVSLRAVSVAAAGLVLLVIIGMMANLGGLRDRLFPGAKASHIRSIAVLPLENLSRDPEQEYFADGMTEALIAELSRIKALKVISRTSVMQYKGTRKPLPQIARELGVDAVVEGSVLREGNQARITVQLIEGATDQHIWADSFQRELRNILSLQGEVAASIAREIRIAVTPEEQTRLTHVAAVDPEAHELTLKARFLMQQESTNRESLERGLAMLRQALQLDPTYAPAYAALSHAYEAIAGVGYKPMREACPEFRAAADKAIELDPALGEAYASRAMAHLECDWDWAGALADAQQAVQLSPGSSVVHNTYAWILSPLGRHQEALEQSRIAAQLDPLSISFAVDRAWFLYYARRYDESAEECRRVLAFAPENIFAKWQLGVTLTAMGKYDEAIATFLSRKVPTAGTNWALGYAYGRAGKRDEARRVLDFLLEKRKHQFIWPGIIAVVYIGMDDKDKAFEWLETTYKEREVWLSWMKVSPMYDPIRSDPRFQDLQRRMNFPP